MIKFSSLRAVLHNREGFNKQSEEFISSIEKEMNEKLTWAEVDDYDATLKLIFIESGGSEGLFLSQFDKLQEPYYFLTSGDNNSLAASLEILTYLKIHNYHGEVIHGDITYIANRIKELEMVEKARKELASKRLGVVGKPSDWLISSIPDYQKVKDIFGIELVDVKMDELLHNYNEADTSSFKSPYILEYDEKELTSAEKVAMSLDKITADHKLDGLTVRCFDLLDSVHTTGCLGLALMNSRSQIGTCEGDIAAMLSMELIRAITGLSSFQANPSRINTKTNEIVFAHCTIPFDMLKSYYLTTHFESGIGVAVKGELEETYITVFRLSSDLKHYFVSEGRIEKNMSEKNLCRTQIMVKLDEDVSSLLQNPCGNHHIIVYGRHKDAINTFMKELSL